MLVREPRIPFLLFGVLIRSPPRGWNELLLRYLTMLTIEVLVESRYYRSRRRLPLFASRATLVKSNVATTSLGYVPVTDDHSRRQTPADIGVPFCLPRAFGNP